MATSLNLARIDELKENAYSNIESYKDPDNPEALVQFTSQIQTVLLADPALLNSVPEYLSIALHDRVKFSSEAKLKWAGWIDEGIQPEWNDFKTTVAFNNADIPLVMAVRGHSKTLLIESCAVLFLLENQNNTLSVSKETERDDDNDIEDDEDGYYDQYDYNQEYS